MKKIVVSFIFAGLNFTAFGMEANQVTEQPIRQSMEIEEPLIQQENEGNRTLGKCLLYCCIGSCMFVMCLACKKCICDKWCTDCKRYPI